MHIVIPLFMFLPIGFAVIGICMRGTPDLERQTIMKILVAAFLLRIAAAIAFASFPQLRLFHEDASGYENSCMRLSAAWAGRGPPQRSLLGQANWGFFWLSGAICYVFGSYRVNVSFFNCVLGTVIVFLVYSLARRFFHFRVARLAAGLVAFTPSMILWSSVALKDTLVTLLIVVTLSSAVGLNERITLRGVLGTVVPLLVLQPLRFYMVYFVAFAVLASLLFQRGAQLVTGIYKQIAVAAVAVALFAMTGLTANVRQGTESLSFERVSSFRTGMTYAGSGFQRDVDISTPVKALTFLPIGLAVLLFGPFPWQMATSLRAMMSGPETIAWWLLVPAVIRGLRLALRARLSETSPLLLFAISLSCAYSLMHGNVGSAFRQRSQVFVFLFIFGAVGWYQKRCRDAGIDERLLLRNDALPVTGSSQLNPATPRA
jgi:4-amino-4-deoxy-L-arabinose transferase-like glycosyltransferase